MVANENIYTSPPGQQQRCVFVVYLLKITTIAIIRANVRVVTPIKALSSM